MPLFFLGVNSFFLFFYNFICLMNRPDALAEDALEFLIVGAAAVQVGTANFVNPQATTDIIDGIEAFLAEKNISAIKDIIGTLITVREP